ncbi:MAG: invasion associated locus B family protein [Fusobacteriaceae bacterium]|jgi:hypothetical protein|nr:invasion associated locus B family protein [Fusobacteriaceae bacterium]
MKKILAFLVLLSMIAWGKLGVWASYMGYPEGGEGDPFPVAGITVSEEPMRRFEVGRNDEGGGYWLSCTFWEMDFEGIVTLRFIIDGNTPIHVRSAELLGDIFPLAEYEDLNGSMVSQRSAILDIVGQLKRGNHLQLIAFEVSGKHAVVDIPLKGFSAAMASAFGKGWDSLLPSVQAMKQETSPATQSVSSMPEGVWVGVDQEDEWGDTVKGGSGQIILDNGMIFVSKDEKGVFFAISVDPEAGIGGPISIKFRIDDGTPIEFKTEAERFGEIRMHSDENPVLLQVFEQMKKGMRLRILAKTDDNTSILLDAPLRGFTEIMENSADPKVRFYEVMKTQVITLDDVDKYGLSGLDVLLILGWFSENEDSLNSVQKRNYDTLNEVVWRP